MPTYEYLCPSDERKSARQPIERNVPIAERDNQYCDAPECRQKLKRIIAFKGLTWAPTSTGGVMR